MSLGYNEHIYICECKSYNFKNYTTWSNILTQQVTRCLHEAIVAANSRVTDRRNYCTV